MLILFIDDDEDDFEIFTEAIKCLDRNISCLRATNGEEALEVLSTLPLLPQYIFMDINMPVMNGEQCLLHLKGEESFSQIPIIVYSKSSHPREKKLFLQLGARDYIVKPNGFTPLVERLRAILK